ncbi:hypothetical protein GCM10010468_54700 [Actinocorallia longicatena]|uniref:Uncharacterized protein n=1 Tax=Actinocorallia longicatena TaxID=111803 RepID=A0ABP6QGP4_9ACTN
MLVLGSAEIFTLRPWAVKPPFFSAISGRLGGAAGMSAIRTGPSSFVPPSPEQPAVAVRASAAAAASAVSRVDRCGRKVVGIMIRLSRGEGVVEGCQGTGRAAVTLR